LLLRLLLGGRGSGAKQEGGGDSHCPGDGKYRRRSSLGVG
jgi:hypothetical protein